MQNIIFRKPASAGFCLPVLCGKILNSVGQVPPDELFGEDNKLLFFNLSDWQKFLIHRRLGFIPQLIVKLGMLRANEAVRLVKSLNTAAQALTDELFEKDENF